MCIQTAPAGAQAEQELQKLTLRLPDMLAPARIPVAAGKNTANTVKKVSGALPSVALNLGAKLSRMVGPTDR